MPYPQNEQLLCAMNTFAATTENGTFSRELKVFAWMAAVTGLVYGAVR
jgi:hypothetical protein